MENNQNICENEKCVFLFNITPTLLLDITLVFGLQYIYIYIYIFIYMYIIYIFIYSKFSVFLSAVSYQYIYI